MGYGMGKLQILEHDGNGGFAFTDHPFVIMKDHAYVNLGVLKSRARCATDKRSREIAAPNPRRCA